MEWYEIVGYILGGSGIIGGVYSIFTMRVKKEGIVIENLKQVIDEIKENHAEYKKENDEKFQVLDKKITKMEIKEKIFTMATNKGYRCPFVPKESNCPVTEILDKSYDILVKELEKKQ